MLDQVRLGAKPAPRPVVSCTIAIASRIVGQGSSFEWSGISSRSMSASVEHSSPSRMKGVV